ncbi:hypothetical protein QZH41_020744 [Actinostola sp. cb2023]|nr:hypothetical protein QZH41_020744 [Actinostola sp. cb2023]
MHGTAYSTAIQEIFNSVSRKFTTFENGKNLKQIMVDFDDAEYNGLKTVIGEKLAEKIIRGCSVHWMRSVNRVSGLVTNTAEEGDIFKTIGRKIVTLVDREKRKRSSLGSNSKDTDSGPPDKRRHVCPTNKRKSGKSLINTRVEVEYQEEDSNGQLIYLGWLTGTIIAYNKSQGYLVRFDKPDRQGEWDDWLPTVKSSDVRFID